MITVELLNDKLSEIIEEEYGEDVIVLEDTGETRKTVTLEMFEYLFGDADYTYESLTQEKYEAYRYKSFFNKWLEDGLLDNEENLEEK